VKRTLPLPPCYGKRSERRGRTNKQVGAIKRSFLVEKRSRKQHSGQMISNGQGIVRVSVRVSHALTGVEKIEKRGN